MYAHIREEMQFFPHIPSPISGFVRCVKLKHVSELRSQEITFYFALVWVKYCECSRGAIAAAVESRLQFGNWD
jgi:hypothetical protein